MNSTLSKPAELTPGDIHRNLLMVSLGSATLLASYLYAPMVNHGPILCPFRLATGLPCPGCGLTRSFCCMARGDLYGAFSYHLFGPVLALGLIIGIPLLITEVVTRRRNEWLRTFLYSKRIGWIAAISLLVYHFSRLVWMGYTGALWTGMHDSIFVRLLHGAMHMTA